MKNILIGAGIVAGIIVLLWSLDRCDNRTPRTVSLTEKWGTYNGGTALQSGSAYSSQPPSDRYIRRGLQTTTDVIFSLAALLLPWLIIMMPGRREEPLEALVLLVAGECLFLLNSATGWLLEPALTWWAAALWAAHIAAVLEKKHKTSAMLVLSILAIGVWALLVKFP